MYLPNSIQFPKSPFNADDFRQYHEAWYGADTCPKCASEILHIIRKRAPMNGLRIFAVHASDVKIQIPEAG